MQKFEYLENEKSFLDETKSIFHNYLRGKQQTQDLKTHFKLRSVIIFYEYNKIYAVRVSMQNLELCQRASPQTEIYLFEI